MIDYIGHVRPTPNPQPLPTSTPCIAQYNEDLFESSKMTFWEHLDEPPRALVKSILSFVIGFLDRADFRGAN